MSRLTSIARAMALTSAELLAARSEFGGEQTREIETDIMQAWMRGRISTTVRESN
jgi:hypothetical protein